MNRFSLSLPLASLASRPLLLAGVLLLANALVHPYRGLYHDARLYAAQVTERVHPGSLAGDLYLRYGSQDGYSVFTPLVAPLVERVGLEPAFFLAYVLSKGLFFWALARLIVRLIPDPLAAVLSLICLAMAPLPFGGNEVFHLNEPFLAPRLPATALTLFAVERALGGRALHAGLLLAAAAVLHPLMAFAGALVLVLWALFRRLSWPGLAVVGTVTALAGAVVVFYQPLGTRVFGHMDDEWREVERHLCFFTDPAVWLVKDWLRIALCAAAAVSAAVLWGGEWRPLAAALLVAGVMGLAGSLVAAHLPYRLLIQGSPYRTLWLLELLGIPLGFAAGLWLWRRPQWWGPPLGLAALVLFSADWNDLLVNPLLPFLAVWPLCALWQRGGGAADWSARATARTLVVGVGVLLAFDLFVLAGSLGREPSFYFDSHPVHVLLSVPSLLYRLPLVLLFALGVAHAIRRVALPRLAGLLAVAALLYQGGLIWLDGAEWYQARCSVAAPHRDFVCTFLRQRGAEMGRRPSVYWQGELRDIWFAAGSSSWFHSVQLSGCAFHRGTALEGKRRAGVVRRFEALQLREHPIPVASWQDSLLAFYGVPADEPATEDDLLAVCAEEGVDFVILQTRFEGLYCASDGLFYVYDCPRVRQRSAGSRGQLPFSRRAALE